MFYLYVIAFPNNKEYVGMTDDPRRRVKQHWKDARGGSAFAVHCAIRHFGGKATFTIIEEAETRDAACELEVQLIAERGTLRPGGYNLTLGGDGGPQAKEVLAWNRRRKYPMGACAS
jgi:predicted GIY-YIG superfamily endonuclease